MKTSFKFLALSFLALALSGCAACSKNSGCKESAAPYTPPPAEFVSAPAVPVAVKEAAPMVAETPVVPSEERIRRAVMK